MTIAIHMKLRFTGVRLDIDEETCEPWCCIEKRGFYDWDFDSRNCVLYQTRAIMRSRQSSSMKISTRNLTTNRLGIVHLQFCSSELAKMDAGCSSSKGLDFILLTLDDQYNRGLVGELINMSILERLVQTDNSINCMSFRGIFMAWISEATAIWTYLKAKSSFGLE